MSKKFDGRKAEIDGRVWIPQDVWANPIPFRKLHTASTICPRQEASDVFHGKAGISPSWTRPGPFVHSTSQTVTTPIFSFVAFSPKDYHVNLIKQRHMVC